MLNTNRVKNSVNTCIDHQSLQTQATTGIAVMNIK